VSSAATRTGPETPNRPRRQRRSIEIREGCHREGFETVLFLDALELSSIAAAVP
jgi:hypothetical protein